MSTYSDRRKSWIGIKRIFRSNTLMITTNPSYYPVILAPGRHFALDFWLVDGKWGNGAHSDVEVCSSVGQKVSHICGLQHPISRLITDRVIWGIPISTILGIVSLALDHGSCSPSWAMSSHNAQLWHFNWWDLLQIMSCLFIYFWTPSCTTHCLFIMIPFLLSLLSTLNRSLIALPDMIAAADSPRFSRKTGRSIDPDEEGLWSTFGWISEALVLAGNFRPLLIYCESVRNGPKLSSKGLRNAPSVESVAAVMAKSSSNWRHASVTAPVREGSEEVISLRMDRRWSPEKTTVLHLLDTANVVHARATYGNLIPKAIMTRPFNFQLICRPQTRYTRHKNMRSSVMMSSDAIPFHLEA